MYDRISGQLVGTFERKDKSRVSCMGTFSYLYHNSWLLVFDHCNSENPVSVFVRYLRKNDTRYNFSSGYHFSSYFTCFLLHKSVCICFITQISLLTTGIPWHPMAHITLNKRGIKIFEPAYDKFYNETCVTSKHRSACTSTQYSKSSHLSLFEKPEWV